MSALFAQQQALLQQQLQVLARIESGLRYSLERLPQPLAPGDLGKAEVLERLASINDRYTKLQDQLSAALRHAHAMIGERYRGFVDVIDWAVRLDLIAQAEVWMELRALRNRLTHDYDLEAASMPEVLQAIREATEILAGVILRLHSLGRRLGLLPANPPAP